MTLSKLNSKLTAAGFPVTYRAWPEGKAPPLPFICYLCTDDDSLFADGLVYYSFSNVRVELYTKLKDSEAEANVEAALSGFHWKKSETYIASERCYMILYEIEV